MRVGGGRSRRRRRQRRLRIDGRLGVDLRGEITRKKYLGGLDDSPTWAALVRRSLTPASNRTNVRRARLALDHPDRDNLLRLAVVAAASRL
uniref:Uncharacterized protein n=1 Tax=Plectus sambesii TaxID=2011161 RepID=A0A914VSI3_9BILA